MSVSFTRRRLLASGAGAAAASLLASPVTAQSWRPTKPVRVIVGDAPGGGTDQVCRAFAEFMSKRLGQPFVVDNRPGANGVVATTEAKNAAPDGYTLLYVVSSSLMTNKVLYKTLPYDTAKDFVPVGACPVAGLVIVVNVNTGAKTWAEFVEYAKKNPASIGTYGAGSLAHIGVAAIEKQYNIPVTTVHYRGGAPMFADLAGGTLSACIGGTAGSMNLVDLGKGRALAVQGRKRLMKFPDVPTFLDMGAKAPGLLLMGHTCMMAPTGVPEHILEVYSNTMVECGSDEATWQKFMNIGAEDKPISRVELKRWIVEDGPIWFELTSGLGLTPS